MAENNNNSAKVNIRVFEIVISLLISICSATSIWTVKTVVEHAQQLSAINASRFTATNGLEVWQEISRIKEAIAKIPTEFPPKWFADRVSNLENRMEKMQVQLNDNNVMLIRISTTIDSQVKK